MYKDSTDPRSSRNAKGLRRLRRGRRRLLAVTAAGAVAVAGMAWMSFAPASAAPEAAAAPPTNAVSAAAAVGATTPFTSYEGEAGGLAGGATRVSAPASPTTKYSSAALEASGHSYVHLGATGQSVQWTNNTGKAISYVNVRASIPDSASGGGITGTLDLYVNGVFRQALNLNSKQTWIYEGTSYNSSNDQTPSHGDPRVFWDESRAFVTGTPIAAGGTLMLKKDSANTASFYDVDVIDVENPPAPIAQPANSISITSCGAVASNTATNGSAASGSVDSRAAIQNCIGQAQSQKKILWIPQGTFYVKGTAGLTANGITIAGAGMWYSNVYRDVPLPNSTALAALFSVTSCTVQNFHIDANAPSRDTILGGDGGAMDTTGTNWVTNGMWAQHTESGIWASGTGGIVENSRFTDTWADGINLNNQSLSGGKAQVGNNLTATNNFIRGAGDDSMAINSTAYQINGSGVRTNFSPMTNTTFSHNTAIAPWGGKGVGAYGGGGQVVSDNYVSDTSRFIGLVVGRFGTNGSDVTSASVTNNVIVRSGGNAYGQLQPAVHIGNASDGQQTGIVNKVTMTGNTISNSFYDAVGFSTSTNSLLQSNTITSPGRNGIEVAPPNYPAPSGSATITGNTLTGLKSGMSAFISNSTGFKATATNNSWQSTTTTPATTSPATTSPAISSSAWYELANQNSGLCVDATNSGTTDGTVVQQYTCVAAVQNQEWQFVSVGSGYYEVLGRKASAQKEAWDVTGGTSATSSGAPLQTWSYHGDTNQQWQAVATTGGYYTFKARNSGLCLSAPNTSKGVQLQVSTCNGTAAQAFRLSQQS